MIAWKESLRNWKNHRQTRTRVQGTFGQIASIQRFHKGNVQTKVYDGLEEEKAVSKTVDGLSEPIRDTWPNYFTELVDEESSRNGTFD